jgi:hypothetical protein
MYSGEYDACDVTLSVYPHRASLKNMPDHGGNVIYIMLYIYIYIYIYIYVYISHLDSNTLLSFIGAGQIYFWNGPDIFLEWPIAINVQAAVLKMMVKCGSI